MTLLIDFTDLSGYKHNITLKDYLTPQIPTKTKTQIQTINMLSISGDGRYLNNIFYDYPYLQKIDNIFINNITIYNHIFDDQSSLQEINSLTICGVTDCNYVFNELPSLRSINNITISNIKNCNYMFHRCPLLHSVGTLIFDNVSQLNQVIHNCPSIQTICSITLSNIKVCNYVFYECPLLQTIDNITLSNIRCNRMIHECPLLHTLNNVTLDGACKSPKNIFRSNVYLEEIHTLTLRAFRCYSYLFEYCTSLKMIHNLIVDGKCCLDIDDSTDITLANLVVLDNDMNDLCSHNEVRYIKMPLHRLNDAIRYIDKARGWDDMIVIFDNDHLNPQYVLPKNIVSTYDLYDLFEKEFHERKYVKLS